MFTTAEVKGVREEVKCVEEGKDGKVSEQT